MLLPEAERDRAGGEVHDHQRGIDDEHGGHTGPGDWQMGAAIEYVSRERPDAEFKDEKRRGAVLEETSHQKVSFRSDMEAHPE